MRIVVRSILRRPLVPVVVVITIGLAIAINTALFSVVDGLLFRPLPYRDADRIVHLELERSSRLSQSRIDIQLLIDRVEATPSLLHRTDARPRLLFDRMGAAVTEWQLRPYSLSPSAFELLGVRPLLGRPFTERDLNEPPYAVLLGYDLWTTRFGGDRSIVGKTIDIPDTSPNRWRIVGVMPKGFAFPIAANFWIPSYPPRPDVWLYGRLSPGVTLGSLRAELAGVKITPLREHVRPRGSFAFGVLLIATSLLLLVALVQVAGLVLAQAARRVTEIGVRLALGASRRQLACQFALESGALIVLALGVATLITPPLTSLIVWALPPAVTLGQYLDPNHRAFSWAGGTAAVGLILLTIVPAGVVPGSSTLDMLQSHALGHIGIMPRRIQTSLLTAQLVIVTTLSYLTALTFHSFINVMNADLGFDPAGLVAVRMPRGDGLIPGGTKARLTRQRQMVAETMARLSELQGVSAVAGGHFWPMQPGGLREEVLPSASDPARFPLPGRYGVITLGFPAVLGLDLVSGSEPSRVELVEIGARMPPGVQLALANTTLARHLERFGTPVGQVIAGRFRIAGVIPDAKLEGPDRQVEPTLFHILPPPGAPDVVLVRLKPGRSPKDLGLSVVLSQIWRSRAPQPLPIAEAVRNAASDHRARTFLLSVVSLFTFPLAALGIAGAVAFAVAQQAREIAIHVALGAQPQQIEWCVVRGAVAAAAIALLLGLSSGVAIGRVARASFFGVGAIDPWALAVSTVLILAFVSIVARVPARRASRINAVEILREA